MKKFLIILSIFLFGINSQAQEKKSKNAKHEVEVSGVCEMCKKRIENAAFTVKGVKSAVWDIETHQLDLILNETKCSVLDVEKAVAKVGQDTKNVKATDEVYNKLDGCCQYERK